MRTVQFVDTEIILLGTAHVSQRSVDDVHAAIAAVEPDAVAVELCQPRFEHLTDKHDWRDLDLFQVIRSRRTGMVAAQLALSAYQKRLGEQLGVEPGGEMRAAIEGAGERNIPVWLIDRNIGVTLSRIMRRVPWYQRWAVLAGLFTTFLARSEVEAQDVERLKQGDVLESAFTEFAESSPLLHETLITERDRYMAMRLREQIALTRPAKVLVVIGAGHLHGLAQCLSGDAAPAGERARLEQVPPAGRFIRILPWAIAAIILAGFTLGFARGPELGWRLVTEWVLINGTLSALGALLARAHPVTILTAFVAAPLTSLNPTIGAGMVTAAVQTAVSPPHMSDFDTVRDDITHWRGWWRNRVARILLVFVFCTLGSAAGTYIAGFRIFEQLVT